MTQQNTPSNTDSELLALFRQNLLDGDEPHHSTMLSAKLVEDFLKNEVAQHTADVVAATEKAYGGCRICYGKGYATVNAQWIGHDTDTDIGSPGGVVRGGNPMSMKYCSCERGKQLEALQARNTQ